ncbi:transposase-like protein [Novosphingobium sp. SG751A]|uniref:IS6 family transposase n=1 Tax=Novosphingobium sp. SG751A TaxID=2587000 RepID=UPI001553D717|nr:IS6 family transposase [Novosphingobium sp. SG751A]NOW48005.1 transposase-like protein [Novosphingobium sp. SG751A]
MFKGRHFDASLILLCVRWYLSYGLSLRNLEEMIAERGISVDHSTIHRWMLRYAPKLLTSFNRRKRPVAGQWHMDETYIKVKGQWMYLYRAIDKVGATVNFMFSAKRNLKDARRFFRRAYKRHGLPPQVTIDGSQTNLEAARRCHGEVRLQTRSRVKPVTIRQNRYMNNRIEQDHRRIKRRTRPMLGFKSMASAAIILEGIELIHMIRKNQMGWPVQTRSDGRNPSVAQQFEALAT